MIKASPQMLASLEFGSPSIRIQSLSLDEMEVYLIGTSIASGQMTVITVKPKNRANFRT